MALRRWGMSMLNMARRAAPRVQSARPVLDADIRQPVDHAASLIRERLGAFDGDFGDTFSHHRETTLDAMFRQGRRDASLSGSRNAYIAGSGNTESTALQRTRTLAQLSGAPWLAVTGGSWRDNLFQAIGAGVGGTGQQRDTAYALGRAGLRNRVVAHSQGNMSVESAMLSLEHAHPAVRQRAVTGIGSPLPAAAGPRSTRVTGRTDPIRLTRLVMGRFLGGSGPRSQHMVPGGHGAVGYLRTTPKALLRPPPRKKKP